MVYTFLETMFFQSGTDIQDKHIFKHGKWLHSFWPLIYSVIVVASNDGLFNLSASHSRSSHVYSCKWLLGCSRKVERSHWTRWTQLSVSLTNRNCCNSIMLTFDSVFQYLVSRYWVPPMSPLLHVWKCNHSIMVMSLNEWPSRKPWRIEHTLLPT